MGVTIKEAAQIVPSSRQLAWQETEFYAFIHFTVNTFTDMEWGTGEESPGIFSPTELDARQWVKACQSAGMKGLILTCKHHDGFCLWPSQYTDHSVKSSPWKQGDGDVVKETAEACREAGLKFGIYVSPWDRHEASYGDSERYNRYFVNQLTELLDGYGELFCVWFDGACGEGPNGKRQVYDWDAYYEVIRRLQPGSVISVCGPDVRWCGNEAGHTRLVEWSVVPASLRDNEKIQANSQQTDSGEFARRLGSEEEDLGSRKVLAETDRVVWYPAETNTSIRPGWFYHKHEDDKVKSVDELVDLYERTVGGNSTFLLNLPPDRRGLIHEQDVSRLQELGRELKKRYRSNLASEANVTASASLNEEHEGAKLTDGHLHTFWRTAEGTESATIELQWKNRITFDRVTLKEHIREGQRTERFYLEWHDGADWHPLYEGQVIGYKKICRFEPVETDRIRIRITESRGYPTLREAGVYWTDMGDEHESEPGESEERKLFSP
ncbi:alpha-L-fucosidase [Paenibacillus sp. JDR-2]|uniref:alpha-L-fucosidase n=1 Tax=Paenibacillus sp. (strain JDR-2) TaxID=324057 RepID=UPI000166A372|nr:alpha-L-fucosidase [Paenibacillus sp. JDR-2]ACT00434.1 coagulation factor 5/8 type domain protein [Paenibacillus sp. JDR-2]